MADAEPIQGLSGWLSYVSVFAAQEQVAQHVGSAAQTVVANPPRVLVAHQPLVVDRPLDNSAEVRCSMPISDVLNTTSTGTLHNSCA